MIKKFTNLCEDIIRVRMYVIWTLYGMENWSRKIEVMLDEWLAKAKKTCEVCLHQASLHGAIIIMMR
ncbi:hypothetical protein EJ02DRAFT_436951 [Clathrospora elynae]|uniref:Uncharacterized protein n=1 Tax=Clathrospora elynae TaxID=706981 RepID=A0A6A5SEZ9_9PLEO|nr:hypothetical protein EJ02DRAFT_436951 [Clathrospora elynae]